MANDNANLVAHLDLFGRVTNEESTPYQIP